MFPTRSVVSPDALGDADSKTILIREGFIENPDETISLVSYEKTNDYTPRSIIKLSTARYRMGKNFSSKKEIELRAYQRRIAQGRIARILLTQENNADWYYRLRVFDRLIKNEWVRDYRLASLTDLAFFNNLLGFGLYGNMAQSVENCTLVRGVNISEMPLYRCTEAY